MCTWVPRARLGRLRGCLALITSEGCRLARNGLRPLGWTSWLMLWSSDWWSLDDSGCDVLV